MRIHDHTAALPTPLRRTEGVILIEALIGLLLFAVGILGLATLQTVTMRYTLETRYRSEAALLANQLIATMWLDKGNSSSNTNLLNYDQCKANACIAWNSKVLSTLPQAVTNPPTVAFTAATQEVDITLRWRHPAANSTSQHRVIHVFQ
jgi:type IV pilus assembly protein PilV